VSDICFAAPRLLTYNVDDTERLTFYTAKNAMLNWRNRMRNEMNVGKYSQSRAISLVRLLVTLTVGLFATSLVFAEVPSTLSYQGRLTTPAGVPVADGSYSIAFRIYDDSTGGNLFWEEIKSVTTKSGLFSVQLGETTPLDQGTFSIPNLFLAIRIGAGAESTPRNRLNVVPYATLVGSLEGASGGMVIGDISATGQVSGISSIGSGGYFQSYQTTAGNHYGLVGKYLASGPVPGSGVYGYSRPSDAFGIGGEFEGGGTGVNGYVNATGNGNNAYTGVQGVAGSFIPELNARLYGVSGIAYGARNNYGVYGRAEGSATSVFEHFHGLYGIASGVGSLSTNYGLWAEGANGNTNYGIVAIGTTLAAYFIGDVAVYGNLTKYGGSFKIDHPLDPANKYLQHSFVESPDMMNIYNGNISLDVDGKATVTMPEWFDALNRDFRYQLTALGAPGPNLYIAQKVTNNQFMIAGGSAGMEVSWQVTGVRHDVWAEAHRIQVEVPKAVDKAGTYMTPELFGMPKSMGETHEMTEHSEEMAKLTEQDRERMAAKRAAEAPKK
jgi:hypothetical protein